MGLKIFKGLYFLSTWEYARVTPQKRRRASILRFLAELPGEQLERIVSIKEYDPNGGSIEELMNYTDEDRKHFEEAVASRSVKQLLTIEILQPNE